MAIDLDNFPTSEAGKRMLASVSPIYDKSYIAKWLFQVMGLQMDDASKYFNELREQAFPELATWGLKYWEQQYGINTDISKPLTGRRNQVIYRRTPKAPMNPQKLSNLLFNALGAVCRIQENVADYTFKVWISSIPGNVNESTMNTILKKVKPAHMSYVYGYEQQTKATLYYGGIITFGKEFTTRQVN
jgi:uncharacterized protein YmfQ (DUF2313 family)